MIVPGLGGSLLWLIYYEGQYYSTRAWSVYSLQAFPDHETASSELSTESKSKEEERALGVCLCMSAYVYCCCVYMCVCMWRVCDLVNSSQ